MELYIKNSEIYKNDFCLLFSIIVEELLIVFLGLLIYCVR
jgi:hypothetical protein